MTTTTNRPPIANDEEFREVLADVMRRLDELEASVAARFAAAADEVRTRRLVVVDEAGAELTVIADDSIFTREFVCQDDERSGGTSINELGVQTRRLVVVDEAGVERITTTCDTDRTMLTVGIVDVNDSLGTGLRQTDATVYIEAELERTGSATGQRFALAQVQCSTGDDAFAILEQRTTVAEELRRRTVTERGELRLHQQRWHACHEDGAMNDGPLTIVELGADGVVERTVSGDLIAHAPMQRVVR